MGQIIVTAEERKEKLTEKLSTQYSLNRISIDEYERLIKYSQNIETDKELTILEKLIEGYEAPRDNNSSYNAGQDRRQDFYGGSSGSDYSNSSQNHISILSSRNTTGQLTTGNFINILSSHKVTIFEEDLVNSETILNFIVILGDVEIRVPESVNVINRAIPVLAEIKIDDNVRNRGGRKDLIINGNVLLGDVKIKINKKSK